MPPELFALLILSLPIACIARTVIFEEVFKEFKQFAEHQHKKAKNIFVKKFFYLFTCEYCFSHWVTLPFLYFSEFTLLYPDWRGYVISFFSLVLVANLYLNLYARLRLEIKETELDIKKK